MTLKDDIFVGTCRWAWCSEDFDVYRTPPPFSPSTKAQIILPPCFESPFRDATSKCSDSGVHRLTSYYCISPPLLCLKIDFMACMGGWAGGAQKWGRLPLREQFGVLQAAQFRMKILRTRSQKAAGTRAGNNKRLLLLPS